MHGLAHLFSRLCFTSVVVLLGVTVSDAAAPLLPVCSWPFAVTGHGLTNVATPDTNATYWVMPLDTSQWQAMVVQGQYPAARFFNVSTYTVTGVLVDTLIDADITPDSGSTNPFATPLAPGSHAYTVTISASPGGATNALRVGGSRLAFVVYRVYVPDQGFDRTGGVGVPAVSLVAPDGRVRSLRPCPFADTESGLSHLLLLLRASGFPGPADVLQGLLTTPHPLLLAPGSCPPSPPAPAPITFTTATSGPGFFPNPHTTYLETAGLCLPAGQLAVVRGPAPVFPNTYLGGSVFEPAFDGDIQLRYWSLCNNEHVLPYPVIACQADFATQRDEHHFYTYVLSHDPAPPAWLPRDATWLPWGAASSPKRLIFRSYLPKNAFMVVPEYVPQGVFCNETQLKDHGWQGCGFEEP
jgi:hypothetical protein